MCIQKAKILDNQIDKYDYELYGLTEKDASTSLSARIKVVEGDK